LVLVLPSEKRGGDLFNAEEDVVEKKKRIIIIITNEKRPAAQNERHNPEQRQLLPRFLVFHGDPILFRERDDDNER
tara:strand:- start:88 stop:315 length:228 start_codon:yes stop_codon:yes gene_type:complete